MLGTLTLAALVALTPAPDTRCTEAVAALDDSLREMYEEGVTFEAFLDGARRRRDLWLSNYARSEVPADLLARARAVPGAWSLLVVAVDSCSDSVNTIPFIARLVDQVDGLDMRIVNASVGRTVMEAHPTVDGRASTPTLVLLNGDWSEVGCFVERPQSLKNWIAENGGEMNRDEVYEAKMAWYDDDGGLSTVAQVVRMLEAAASGAPVCG